MLCLEEGVVDLPPPVTNFHATYVDDDKAIFVWEPTEDGAKIDQYELYYKKLGNNSSPASAFEHEAVRPLENDFNTYIQFDPCLNTL